MKKWKLLALPLVALSLTACGEDLDNALNIGDYRSDIFSENMYSVWPSELSDVESTATHLVDSDHLITGFTNLDEEDYGPYADDQFGSDFSAANKLSATDSDVAYGFTSKLFDGILHCFDAVRSTKSRLQLPPEGFGYAFPHEMWTQDYVGLFLKSGADTIAGGSYISDATFHLSFYVLNDTTQNYIEHRFDFTIEGIVNTDYPEFYGFYFEDILVEPNVLQGTQAVSLTYEIMDAVISPAGTQAIFVYELLLPNSTWR